MNTTSLVKGTSLENVESQTQQDQPYLGLPNRVEAARNKREVRAIFEVMANLVGAIDGTPSMIDEVDDDNTPLGHVSQQTKVGIDEDGFPTGSPNSIDDVAKSTMEDPMERLEMERHTKTQNSDGSRTGILDLLMSPSQDDDGQC